MARVLRVRLINLKKELNAEQHRINTEREQLQAQQAELEAKAMQLDQKLLLAKAHIERADRYGVLHSKETMFTCVPCFVYQDILQNMLTTEPVVSGVKRYKCPRCGEGLNSDDQP